MPGLALAADADAVIVWLDRLSLDETVFDNLAAFDGAELSLSERMSNILIKTTGAPFITESHHRLALRLLLVGANTNRKSHGHWSPLHLVARARGAFSLDLVETLLANGADPNARTAHGAGNKTPLAVALEVLSVRPSRFPALEIIRALLRRGADIDSICGSDSAENRMWRIEQLRGSELSAEQNWLECSDMFESLRALGSWKAVVRRPHVRMLVLRALVVRNRATTCDVILRRLVTLPDVVLWRVLSYWRATE